MPQLPVRLIGSILKLLLPVLLMMPCGGAWAAGGDVRWDYHLPLADQQNAGASVVDHDNNVIIAGATGSPFHDYLVAKIKADGSGFAWKQTYGHASGKSDVAKAVAVDHNNNVVVTGYSWNGVNNDVFTVKYDGETGDKIWEHRFNGRDGGEDRATAIAIDEFNNTYVAGSTRDIATNSENFLILKYGPGLQNAPVLLWIAPEDKPVASGGGPGHQQINALVVRTYLAEGTPVTMLAVTGKAESATPGVFDVLTQKYDASGNFIWEKTIPAAGSGEGLAVGMDSQGRVAVAGYTDVGGTDDAFAIRYASPDGAADPINRYDGGYNDDHANDLWIDDADTIYVAGKTETIERGDDVFVARYNPVSPDGSWGWSRTYNTANGNHDVALALTGNATGGLYVVGHTFSQASGSFDLLVLKYQQESGALLWDEPYDEASHNDEAVDAHLSSDGHTLFVTGRVDVWTGGTYDYDFAVVAYEPGALDPPTGLSGEVLTNTQIALSWIDNAEGEEGFALERKICTEANWTTIADQAILTASPGVSGTVSFTDSELTPDSRYCYRVKATSSVLDDSRYSEILEIKSTVINYDQPTWLYSFNGNAANSNDKAAGIAIGADDHPVVVGSVMMKDNYGEPTGYDYFTAKLNRDTKSVIWKAFYNDESYEGDFATSVAVIDATGRVVVTGYASLFSFEAGRNTNDIYTLGYPTSGLPVDANGNTLSLWADQYVGAGDDRAKSVSVAKDGGNNTVVIGYGDNGLNDDIYVIKIGSDGTRRWAATPYNRGNDDYPAALDFDAAGNVFVVGDSANTSNTDFVVIKYNASDGSLGWGGNPLTYNGGGTDVATDVVVDSAGNLFVTGLSVNANADFFTFKVNGATGVMDPTWRNTFNGPGNGYDRAVAVAIDPITGDILVAGTTYVGPGDSDFMLIRYDMQGNIVWQRQLLRPGSNEELVSMAIDQGGAVTLAGTTTGAGKDILAVKYNPSGEVFSAKVFDGSGQDDVPLAVAVNAVDEAFIAGYTTTATYSTDLIVFKLEGADLRAPYPFTASPYVGDAALSWTNYTADVDGFTLQSYAGACSDEAIAWSQPPLELAAYARTYTATGLGQGQTYCYRIRAHRANGDESSWSKVQFTTTLPTRPSGLTVTALNSAEAKLTWSDTIPAAESGYEFHIQRCQGATCAFVEGEILEILPEGEASYSGQTVTWIDTGVCPGQTYRYQVMAKKPGLWVTVYSDPASGALPQLPAGPIDLTAISLTEVDVRLNWTSGIAGETGWAINRCTDADCADFAYLNTVDPDTGVYNDRPPTIGKLYRYRVRAVRTGACGWPSTDPADNFNDSNIAEVQTNLLAPEPLSLQNLSTTSIKVDWPDLCGSEENYRIERCAGTIADCDTDGEFSYRPALLGAGATSFTDDTVCEDGQYYTYRVRCENGTAGWSGGWAAGDIPARSASLATFNVANVSESQINITWTNSTMDVGTIALQRCAGESAACVDDAQFTTINNDVSVFRMEEAAWSGAGAVTDLSWYGRHATAYGGMVPLASGRVGKTANFDGVDDYIQTPISIDQSSAASPPMTFMAWVYPTTNNTIYKYIFSTESSTNGYDWGLAYRSMDLYVTTGSTILDTNADLPLNTWSHVAVVFQPGTGISIYLNGNLASTKTIDYDAVSNNLSLGRIGTGGNYFAGRLDEVAIYRSALTADQIKGHVQVGGGYATFPSFKDEGLYPQTAYTYRVKASKSATCAWNREIGRGATTTPAAVAPGSLTATTPNTTEIDLGWSDLTYSETGFKVERCQGSGTSCDDDAEFTYKPGLLAAGAINFADPSVCIATDYTYRVRAERSGAPNWPTLWSTLFKRTPELAAAPVLTATRLSESEIRLNWNDAITDEGGFKVLRCESEIGVSCTPDTEIPATINADAKTFTDNLGIKPSKRYTYLITAYKSATCPWPANYSNAAFAETTIPAPTPMTAVADGLNQVNLQWSNNYATVTQFRLQRCSGAGEACNDDGEFADLPPVLPGAATGTVDATVCPGSPYTYRVRAERVVAEVTEWYSQWATAYAETGAATAPTLFTATPLTEAAVVLNWQGNWQGTVSGEDYYRLRRCNDNRVSCLGSAAFDHDVTATWHLYRMDESSWNGTSGEVHDIMINGAHGTAGAGVTPVAEGKYGRAGSFDGVNDVVSTPLNLDQSVDSRGVTLEAWVKPVDTTVNGYRFVIGTGSGWGIAAERYTTVLWSATTVYHVWTVSLGGTMFRTASNVALDTWQHVAVVYEPGVGIRFYLNGSLASTITPDNIAYTSGDANVAIGSNGTGGQFFGGLIDEAAVIEKPLTTAQVLLHAQQRISGIEAESRGLDAGQSYTFKVTGVKEIPSPGCSWESAPAYVEISTPAPPPPTNFRVTGFNTTEINLAWDDVSGSETGFVIGRCRGSGTLCDDAGEYTEFFNVAENAETFKDITPCFGEEFSYRLRAVKTTDPPWQTDWVGPIVATTTIALPPTNVVLRGLSESQVAILWDDPNSDETGYVVERCLGADASCDEDHEFSTVTFDQVAGARILYEMDEAAWTGAAGEIANLAINNQKGTAFGGATTVADGRYGRAGSFDGTNDYVATGFDLDQSATSTGATMEAWVYPTATGTRQIFGTGNWGLGQSTYFGTTWYLYGTTDSYSYTNTNIVPTINQWQHVAVVFEPGAGIRFYLDGTLVYSMTADKIKFSTTDVALMLGQSGTGANFFAGRIDEVAVHDRALSGAEVLKHYQNSVISYRTDSARVPETRYTYRVKGYKEAVCAWTLTSAELPNLLTPPASPPSEFVVTEKSTTHVALRWQDNTAEETGFRIERCLGTALTCDTDAEFDTLVGTAAPNQITITDNFVCAGTTYTYRVRAEKDGVANWPTAPWTYVSDTTLAVATPAGFSVQSVTDSTARVSWSDATSDEDAYRLDVCNDVHGSCEDSEYGPVTSTELFYRISELSWSGSPGEVRDILVAGPHGQAMGGAAVTAQGKYGRGGSFDGVDDYIATPFRIDQTAQSTGVTMEAWIYPTKTGTGYQYIIGTDNGGFDWGLGLYRSSTSATYSNLTVSSGTADVSLSTSLNLNQWSHLATTFVPGTGIRYFVNGAYVGVRTLGGYDASDATVTIGRRGSLPEAYFGGYLDEVAVFNRVLSDAEILAHYNQKIGSYMMLLSGIEAGSNYTYRLSSQKSAACGWTSPTTYAELAAMLPEAPANFAALATNTTTIRLSWDDKTTSETGFEVERCQGSTAQCTTDAEFTQTWPVLATNTEEFIDTLACEGLPYTYRIRAVKEGAPSWPSDWAYAEGTATAKATPIGLTAQAVSGDRIEVAWDLQTADETGVVLERCGGAAGCQEIGFAAGTESHADTGLDSSVLYTYRVKALKTSVACGWETEFSAAAQTATYPVAPNNLRASLLSPTSVLLEWDEDIPDEDGFEVEVRIWSGHFAPIGATGPNVRSFIDTGMDLEPNTTYTYRVRAYRDTVKSPYSDTAEVTTDPYQQGSGLCVH